MQIFINGIISGLVIAVLALAFSVVYLPTRVFHIALGGIYTFVPYIAFTCLELGCPWYLAAGVATVAGITVSLGCEVLNHARLDRNGASSGVHLISSLGLNIIIVQIVALIWGNETKVLRRGLDNVYMMRGVVLTGAQVLSILLATAAIVAVFLWLKFSNLGLRFRGLAENNKELALLGYNTKRLRLVAFGMSGILCSVSALLVCYDMGFEPHSGLYALCIAFVAVIIGGKDVFIGPVVGGIILGLVRGEIGWYLSSRWEDAMTFLLLSIFLLMLPNGMVDQKSWLETKR